MPAYLELWKPSGPELVALDGERVSLGKGASNDVVVSFDSEVSRLHAVFERYAGGWCVRDLQSTNGTFVNGERVWGERPLHGGDELRVGRTRLVYRSEPGAASTKTATAQEAPQLTRREREVLVELCRPVLGGDVFTEPSSIRDIARRLVVTDAAVKQHLTHLYDKFGIYDEGRRRVRLANEAIRRGAVGIGDLRGGDS